MQLIFQISVANSSSARAKKATSDFSLTFFAIFGKSLSFPFGGKIDTNASLYYILQKKESFLKPE